MQDTWREITAEGPEEAATAEDLISSSPAVAEDDSDEDVSGIDTGVDANEADVIEQSQTITDSEEDYPHDLR